MKKLIIILFTAFTSLTAKAQASEEMPANTGTTSTTVVTKQSPSSSKVIYANSNNFLSFINMKTNQNLVYFENLIETADLQLYVTDASGREVYRQRINARFNAFKVNKLPKGLYFVTLVNEDNDSRKTFTLNL